MTETGGFAFLIAWSEFVVLGLILALTIARRGGSSKGRDRAADDQPHDGGDDR